MNRQGFTLIETLVAIFLLTMGVGGAFILVNQNIVSADLAGQRLTAAYLAQEGIEIARNIRDSNFLKIHRGISGVDWDTGLDNNLTLPDFGIFKRKVVIIPEPGVDPYILKVSIEIFWQERGRDHKFVVKENLYKWQQ